MSSKIILYLLGLLFFVLPIAHTIGIRNGSAVIILCISIYIFYQDKIYLKYTFGNELRNIVLFLVAMTIWIYFVAFFISPETDWTLSEIRGQWLTPMLYFFGFMLLFINSIHQDKEYYKKIYAVIFFMLLIHIIYIDLFVLKHYIDYKVLLSRVPGVTEVPGLTGGPDKANYLTNILLSFIVAEFIYRIRTAKKLLNIDNTMLLLIFAMTIASSIFEGMRNGVVAILFMSTASIVFVLYNNQKITKKTKLLILIAIVLFLSIPAVYNFKHDTRWSTLINTIPVALDTKNNKSWIDDKKYPLPKLPNGQTVGDSNYLRIAWFYEGSKLILENPMGIGYGRNAFGHGIKNKYDLKKQIGHSHSGLIDMGVGIGILGLMIWLSFGVYLLYISYVHFKKYNSYFSVLLFFNTTGFFSRFVVDSNLRDHMFETFLILIALSLVFMLNEKYEKHKLN